MSFAADPRIEQGAIFEAKGEYEMALGEYRAILAEQPQNSEAYFLAAEVYMKMPKQDLARALANYRLAYKFTPTMSKAYEGAAKVYKLMGQKAKAEEELAKDPKNRPPEPVEAAPVAEAAPVEAPAPEPVKAESKQEVAKLEPAKKEEPAKPVEQPKQEAKAAEPAKPVETVKPAEPAKTADAPAKDLPADPFEKGKALFAEGKFKDAAPLWREVLAKQPGHTGAYFYAGLTRYEMGEYDKAEINLKKGLSYKDRGNDANYFLGLVYQKLGRSDAEKKALSAYLKKAAPDAQYRKPAEARLAEMKAKADSVKVANAAPAAEPVAAPAEQSAPAVEPAPSAAPVADATPSAPSDVPSIANANLLVKARSYELALQIYKKILETDVSQDERYFITLQMGNIYRELRDFHSAVTRYRTVVQQYPESDWATEAERALEDAVWLEKHASELPRRTR